jgi:hypothetical protein
MGVSVCCANKLMLRIKKLCSGISPIPDFQTNEEKAIIHDLENLIPNHIGKNSISIFFLFCYTL